MHSLKKEVKKDILKVLIFIAVLAIILVQVEKVAEWIFIQGPEKVKLFFDQFIYFAPILFVLLCILANMILMPLAIFVFISAIVFGPIIGFLLSILSIGLSAAINFFLGKEIKETFFIHKIMNKKIKFIQKHINKHGFGLVLALRFIGVYFDVMSYAAGMTKIKFKDFLFASILGSLPYIFIYIYAGNRLMNIRSSDFIYIILLFHLILVGVFALGYWAYIKFKTKH